MVKPEKEKNLGIRFHKMNRLFPLVGYKEDRVKVGSYVVVETDRGLECGQVIFLFGKYPKKRREFKLKKIKRYATREDLECLLSLEVVDEEAFLLAQQKVKEHETPIRIINAETIFDGGRVIFYYKVNESRKGKVNIKELGKDLATAFQKKVDMRLVSARDEAKVLKGIGPCGRNLCCGGWLEKQPHVTVKMVKDQGIAISPPRTMGMCGRLMCCFQYEHGKKE